MYLLFRSRSDITLYLICRDGEFDGCDLSAIEAHDPVGVRKGR